jgi:hypothetical protein
MFAYATRVLHLAEGEAFRRIRVARASRRHPILLEMLADGRLHVSGIAVLAPVLTSENRAQLLSRAAHKTKRELEQLVVELAPRPDVPSVVRKVPERPAVPREVARPVGLFPGTVLSPPARASEGAPRHDPAPVQSVEALAPARYKIQFTAGEGVRDDLERLRALLRSEIPDGDVGTIVGKAVRELRQRLEARRFGQTSAPRSDRRPSATSSRSIPAAVRRAVYRRDGGRCSFVDARGIRCPERHRLEYHHRHPYGMGGGHDGGNIGLMCPAHNRYLAEVDYGAKLVSRHIASSEATRSRNGPATRSGTSPAIRVAGGNPP